MQKNINLLYLTLFFLGFFLFLAPLQIQAAPSPQEITPGDGVAPPPLPALCGGGGTSIPDYDTPICCMSGYVYLNGEPTHLAEITVQGPHSDEVVRPAYKFDEGKAFFSVSLQDEPLNIVPGDRVTVTATYQNRTTAEYFVAKRTRTLQIDLVLPDMRVDSAWIQGHLSGRSHHAMVYDEARGQTVLFGGLLDDEEVQNDTWLWDGDVWQQLVFDTTDQPIPPARQGHTLVYHEGLERVLLFGGEDANKRYLNDLWAWDGSLWHSLESEGTLPAARRDHAMSYDRDREQIVLFGGRNASGLADTWLLHIEPSEDEDARVEGEWEAVEAAMAPPARYQHGMSYDQTLDVMVLFGGQSMADDSLFDDTWAWDGENWIKQPALARPPALAGHGMAYHPRAGVLLFGGEDSDGDGQEGLWVWNGSVDGERWIQRETTPDMIDEIEMQPDARTDVQMVYDAARQQMLVFGGLVSKLFREHEPADTWAITEDATTWQQVDTPPPFAEQDDVAMSYEQGGSFLIFSGQGGDPNRESSTYRWRASQWEPVVTENQPSERIGHRLSRDGSSGDAAYSCEGNRILLFGGIEADGTYLNDTWLWQGTDWERQRPETKPPTRAYHTLSYDCQKGEWILFGGRGIDGQPLNDLWVYNGTDWQERIVDQSPAARYQATLSYNPHESKMLLFGGSNDGEMFFNDLWAWDGDKWETVAEEGNRSAENMGAYPPARAIHGAVYDPERQRLFIAGGRNDRTNLRDTWSWDGQTWRSHLAAPSLLPTHITSLDYDPIHKQLVGLIDPPSRSVRGEGVILYQILQESVDEKPLATISYVNPKDAYRSQSIVFEGRGGDSDNSDTIVAYQWEHEGRVISTERVFTTSAEIFPPDVQVVTYSVQDDEGSWSAPVERTLYIREDGGSRGIAQPGWTLLVYAAGDNDLGEWLGDDEFRKGLLYRLKGAGAQANVRVAVLYDGPLNNDTARYILTEEGDWEKEELPEADMGDVTTLSDFVTWGYENLPSDYHALHIASHANGIIGIGMDEHGGEDRDSFNILTPLRLREALMEATQEGTRRLDLLHYDGCSFGLLENAAIADGLAHFIVASPNTALGIFAYEEYRKLAAEAQTPQAYGESIVNHYAERIDSMGRAYTISLFDMTHFKALEQSMGELGTQLGAYLRSDDATLKQKLQDLRKEAQGYDSGGLTDYEIDDDDEYVDIGAWLKVLLDQVDDIEVGNAVSVVQSVLDSFIVENRTASGTIQDSRGNTHTIEFSEDTSGVGLYYPPRSGGSLQTAYGHYISNKLFDITQGWGWANFIDRGIPATGTGLLMDPTRMLSPIAPDEVKAQADTPEEVFHTIYLPLVNR